MDKLLDILKSKPTESTPQWKFTNFNDFTIFKKIMHYYTTLFPLCKIRNFFQTSGFTIKSPKLWS